MHLLPSLVSILSLSSLCSAAILLPRAPKGGGGSGSGGGGGGRGGGGGGRGGGSSSSGRGGSGDTGRPAISYGNIDTGGRSANYFGGGGGIAFVLTAASVFHSRQMGGGGRPEIVGTRTFGSGYPYSVGDIGRTGVSGQPFPFGFWPIYWAGHGHSDEYGANTTVAAERPGGEQVLVELISDTTSSIWNTTMTNGVNETYWMIGDRESVTTLLSILVDSSTTATYGCGVQNLTIQTFNSSDPLQPVHIENVIQWYRASSFALAFLGYNNSYTFPPLNETANMGWEDSTPLASELQYSPFLQCVNETISAALPILDQESPRFSPGQIGGIVVGCIFGALFLCCCLLPCIRAIKRNIQAPKKREGSKPTIRKTFIQDKPAFIVTDSPSDDYRYDKAPASPSLPPYSHTSLESHSPTCSYTTMNLPQPAFIRPGHESFYSSRTLVTERGTAYDHEKSRHSFLPRA